MAENKNSAAKIAANNRYAAKTYDRINLAVPKGQKEIIQQIAKSRGESVNGFICKLIQKEIARTT